MSDSKHTPTGNWRAYESASFKGEWGVETDDPAMVSAGDEIIVYPSLSEQHARLIAAAPGMLSIHKRLCQWDIDFPVNCHNGYAGLKELDHIIADARAAVAQADGAALKLDYNALDTADLDRTRVHLANCIECRARIYEGDDHHVTPNDEFYCSEHAKAEGRS